MNSDRPFEKVSSFVTREGSGGTELLLFEHPSAGVQVPAGSVEEGETPVAAARREVTEETGIDAEVVAAIGTTSTELGVNRILLQTEQLCSAPAPDAAPNGHRLRRGLTVQLADTAQGFSLVVYEEYDLNQQPRVLLKRVDGWVPATSLGDRVTRHFFHLRFSGETPMRWKVEADDHIFRPFWAPLTPRPTLTKGQDEWLRVVYDRLLASARAID